MATYHITTHGEPARCHATVHACPREHHYASLGQAQEALGEPRSLGVRVLDALDVEVRALEACLAIDASAEDTYLARVLAGLRRLRAGVEEPFEGAHRTDTVRLALQRWLAGQIDAASDEQAGFDRAGQVVGRVLARA